MSALAEVLTTPSSLEQRLADDVRAASAGDLVAYGRIVDGTRTLVCSIALGIVRDKALSEDVAQDVYIAVWQGLARLRNTASFLPWLRQLTRNRAQDQRRTLARRRLSLVGVDAMATLPDPQLDAGAALAVSEERAALTAAFDALNDSAREVVTLFYREGRSTAQVAELLGLRETAVKKRLQRAREELREATLERLGETLAHSAPAAGFTAAVLAGLTTGAPATATAAAKVSIAALGTKAVTATAFGAGAGVLFGVLGALAGAGFAMRRARDVREKLDLLRFGIVNALLVVACVLLMPYMFRALGGAAGTIVFAACWAAMVYNHAVWLPKITARRYAAELAEDPTAAIRHRRERQRSLFGCIFGGAVGFATCIWAWVVLGHQSLH